MSKVDRKAVHQFLDELLKGEPLEEQVAILKDIIVSEFCFQGRDPAERSLNDLEKEVHDLMAKPEGAGLKIQTIKKVRELTGLGLAEAKHFVESLTPGHPNYGTKPDYVVSNKLNSMITDHLLNSIGATMNRIAKDYGKEQPF